MPKTSDAGRIASAALVGVLVLAIGACSTDDDAGPTPTTETVDSSEPVTTMRQPALEGSLEVVATDSVDVALPLPATGALLLEQAEKMGTLLGACLTDPATCTTFMLWGYTDRHSWIPTFLPGFGAATPLDRVTGLPGHCSKNAFPPRARLESRNQPVAHLDRAMSF